MTNKKALEDAGIKLGVGVKVIEDAVPQERRSKVGTFVVVNTATLKGVRLNLEKVESYALGGENTVQIAKDNGTQMICKFQTEEETNAFLAWLDSFCL